jgi:hypothetical protein
MMKDLIRLCVAAIVGVALTCLLLALLSFTLLVSTENSLQSSLDLWTIYAVGALIAITLVVLTRYVMFQLLVQPDALIGVFVVIGVTVCVAHFSASDSKCRANYFYAGLLYGVPMLLTAAAIMDSVQARKKIPSRST